MVKLSELEFFIPNEEVIAICRESNTTEVILLDYNWEVFIKLLREQNRKAII